MRSLLAAFCFAIALCASTPAFALQADHRAFPPDNCSSASPFMGFTGVDGSNTFCNSGQDILKNALTSCAAGQELAYDNGQFICRTIAVCSASEVLAFDGHNYSCKTISGSVPTCPANTFLTYDGTNYSCAGTGVPACAANQVLTFNGSNYYCVNRTDSIPSCGANQFLTYNGSYQCAGVITPAIPSCPAGQVVTGNGSALSCTAVATTPTALATGVITTNNTDDPNSGFTTKTDTVTLSQPGLLTSTGYFHLLPGDTPSNLSLRYRIVVDGQTCTYAGDMGHVSGGNMFVTASCTMLLAAGSHTITSDTMWGNWDGSGDPWSLDAVVQSDAALRYVIVPMNAPGQ